MTNRIDRRFAELAEIGIQNGQTVKGIGLPASVSNF